MPIIKSAVKRMRQTSKRRNKNIEIKKSIKLAAKSFVATPAADTLGKAQSELDKAVKKGLIKKHTADRRKAALHRQAKAAGVKLAASKKVAEKPAAKPAAEKKPVAKTAATKKPAAKKPAAKS
jgi:ribosomal protein S20